MGPYVCKCMSGYLGRRCEIGKIDRFLFLLKDYNVCNFFGVLQETVPHQEKMYLM